MSDVARFIFGSISAEQLHFHSLHTHSVFSCKESATFHCLLPTETERAEPFSMLFPHSYRYFIISYLLYIFDNYHHSFFYPKWPASKEQTRLTKDMLTSGQEEPSVKRSHAGSDNQANEPTHILIWEIYEKELLCFLPFSLTARCTGCFTGKYIQDTIQHLMSS